jgi:hypothetical protein
MHMHIGCCRKDEQAAAVNHPVCRNAGTGMTHNPVRYRNVGNPPVRKTDIPQYKGRPRFHSTHFFCRPIKTWEEPRVPDKDRNRTGKTNNYSIRIMQYSVMMKTAGRTAVFPGEYGFFRDNTEVRPWTG